MKIAVLIYGMYREFDIAISSWDFLKKLDCDVYFSTWSTSKQRNKKLDIIVDEEVTEKRILDHVKNARISISDDIFSELTNPEKMIFHWKSGLEMIKKHNIKYDYLMLTRPDNYFAFNIDDSYTGMNFSEDVASRWIAAYNRLSPNCKARLVVENDDKASSFSVVQLFTYLHAQLNIPITFDYFHHQFHPDGLSTQDAAELAAGTWPEDIVPLFHYSESKNLNENVTGNPRAHADYVFNKIDDFGMTLDFDLEAKAKELALFKYWELS